MKLFLLIGTLLFASRAFAAPPCVTLDSCLTLERQVADRLEAVRKSVSARMSDVLNGAVGDVLHPNVWEAQSVCDSLGLRLPKARELAYYAQGLGAAGVRESPAPGYQLVSRGDDAFYYRSLGFRPPAGEFAHHWYWTSDDLRYDGYFPVIAMGGGNAAFFTQEGPEGSDTPGRAYRAVVCIADESPTSGSDVCRSLADCLTLAAQIDAELSVLRTGLPTLSDLPRNADGSVRGMSQLESKRYCESKGLRLPTVKELALWARGNGSRVSDVALAGFQAIDDLYYSARGYQHAADVKESYSLWSNTSDPSIPTLFYALAFDGRLIQTYGESDRSFDEARTARCSPSIEINNDMRRR